MDTKVTADNGTVAECDCVGIVGATIGDCCRTADGTASGCRGVRIVSRDLAAVKKNVGATISTNHHTS